MNIICETCPKTFYTMPETWLTSKCMEGFGGSHYFLNSIPCDFSFVKKGLCELDSEARQDRHQSS
jgi:hypothetical protein